MTGIAIFSFLIGTLIGVAMIPAVYGIRYLKSKRKRHGFKDHRSPILNTDAAILKSKREEHSAQEYH